MAHLCPVVQWPRHGFEGRREIGEEKEEEEEEEERTEEKEGHSVPILLWVLNSIVQIKIFSLIIHSTTQCLWKLVGLVINLPKKELNKILHSY